MNDHTYVAADMYHAMKLVKEDMGPDAVILSHRSVMEGVEIVAAPAEMLASLQQKLTATQSIAASAQALMTATTDDLQGLSAPTITPAENVSINSDSNMPSERSRSFSFSGLARRSLANKAKPGPTRHSDHQSSVDDVMVSLSNLTNQTVGQRLPGTVQANPAHAAPVSQPANSRVAGRRVAGPRTHSTRTVSPQSEIQQPSPSDRAYEQMIHKNNMELSAMRDELSGLKELLEAQFKAFSWSQFNQQSPIQASVWKRLQSIGLETFLCEELVSRLGVDDGLKQAWSDTSEHLKRMLPIFGEDLCDYSGIVSLVGPTGAGKTTTIGKIAAHHVLKYGVDEVALVSTDSYRIASREQLNSYGRILGIPVYSVTESQSLDQILEGLNKRRLVLIDNPGLSGDEVLFSQHLDQICHSRFPIDNFFVMPCTSQYQVLESYLDRLNQIDLQGCIASKTDEASVIGHVLSLAIGYELPLASYTDGQNIPDDIYQAQPQRLVSMATDIGASNEKQTQTNCHDEIKDGEKQAKTPRMDLNGY